MAQISNGESGLSARNKLNEVIDKIEGNSAIGNDLTITGTVTADGLTVNTTSAVTASFSRDGTDGDAVQIFNGAVGTTKALGLGVDGTHGTINSQYGGVKIQPGGTTSAFFGTGNDISFYDSAGTTAKMVWKAANERLGIGTSSPLARFQVSQESNLSLTDSDAKMRIEGLGYTAFFGLDATSFQIGQNSDLRSMTFHSGNGMPERMRIDASGNVGIGTPTTGTYRFNCLRADGNLAFFTDGATADLFIKTTAGVSTISPTTGTLALGTSSTERMRIDSLGRVGIGTSNPSYKVDISHNANALDGLTVRSTDSGSSAGAQMILNGYGNSWGIACGSTAKNSNSLTFSLDALGANTERMRITSTGSVGIGTSSITSGFKMEVIGDARFGDVYNDDAVELGWSAGGSAGFVQAYDRGASAFRDLILNNAVTIDSSGNVGIGTDSPAGWGRALSLYNPTLDSGITFEGVGRKWGIGGGYTDGALRFYDFTGSSEAMRIDSSGNLLVGTTDSTLYNNTTGGGANILSDGLTTIARETATTSDTVFVLNDTGAGGSIQEFRKDGSTVGSIGTLASALTIGSGDTGLFFQPAYDRILPVNTTLNATSDGDIDLGANVARFKDLYLSGGLRGDTTFKNNAGTTEYARFDASGNLLVGTTVTPATLTGTSTESGIGFDGTTGYGVFVRNGSVPLYANRLGTDGPIQEFRKDGTTVGSIGTIGGFTVIGSGDTGILFDSAEDAVKPRNSSTASRDAAIDLGGSDDRWKDLYLSGGVYLGGTGSANKLDDYETGYFEPNIQPSSGSITWNTDQNKLSYTKIGRLVHVTGQLAVSSVSSPSGITRGSLPFTQLNQDEQSERTTGVVLVQNTSLNVNEFGIYPNGGSDTFLEIVRTNATSVQRDAGSYFNSSTVIQVNYTYVAV